MTASAVQSGSSFITDAERSETVSRGTPRPASISKNTTPNEKMSARRSTVLPWLLRRHVRGGAEDHHRPPCPRW